ncbi:response regulator transcription factor [Paenibacillus sp. 1001270B_150601_E10]|uniref:response regulator transcription factor n=1 Tax=Paenibacillus sp. 1001270B_150601_E10 TaxID=2787079 RepID=UPI00189D8DAF|nr:response regulator transcription factor [Paenibacillus sp. 1001270B_150601_E10]
MIRIFIAEDQRMLLGALGSLLNLEDDMEVIGQATQGEEALSAIEELQPDVCLMDIEMPVRSGLEVAESLREQQHPAKIIMLTTFAKPGYFERAAKIGVDGYLLKDSSIDDLADAIRKVMAGKRIFSPELMFDMMNEPNPLTLRETEILLLLAEGKSTSEITKLLFLSTGTVRNYISEIIQKLDAKSRIDAIHTAQEKGWI